VLHVWVKRGWISWEDINLAVNGFKAKLIFSDNKDYPGRFRLKPGRDFKMAGNIAQMSNVVRFFPLIFAGEKQAFPLNFQNLD